MTHIFGRDHNAFVKMIVFGLFVVFAFLENQVIATGKLDLLLSEFSGREELVEWAGYGEEKLSTVVIGGKLLCHGGGKTSLHPDPVSGATVAVFCGASGKMKKSWTKGSTDSTGDFIIDLPSNLHGIPNLEKICHVKVVHLPKTSPCQHSCTRKLKPIKLTSIGEGIRSYTTHNIYLMPPHKPTS